MSDSKPAWASKTLWVNLIAGVGAIGTAFGLDLGLGPEQQTAIVGGIMAVANIALRFVTKGPIGKRKEPYRHVPKAKFKVSSTALILAVLASLVALGGCANNPVANVGERPDSVGLDLPGPDARLDAVGTKAVADVEVALELAKKGDDPLAKGCWESVLPLLKQFDDEKLEPVGVASRYQMARNVRRKVTGTDFEMCKAMGLNSASIFTRVFGF